MAHSLLDPSIFSHLESKLEEETQIRDALTQILQRLERSVGAAQGLLTKVHSTPRASCTSTSLSPQCQIKPIQFKSYIANTPQTPNWSHSSRPPSKMKPPS